PPNVETVGDAGLFFAGAGGAEDLRRQLERVLSDPDLVAAYRARAIARARRYSWDAVTDQYERLLQDAVQASGPGRLPEDLIDAAPA
ncbi:MAG TPA: hypothetical protein VF533_08075, partial [Solirubrobacteraceae bacterium]